MITTMLHVSRAFLFFCVWATPAIVIGQVTTNGGSGLSTNYASLADAVAALNAVGTTSTAVTITLQADETAPSGGHVITATGSGSAPIVLDGNGRTLTAFASQPAGSFHDAIIEVRGGDHVTIQGFVLQENPANTTTGTSNNMTEWGIALTRASTSDGPQYCTVTGNTISLDRTHANTFGIYSNVIHDAQVPSTYSNIASASGAQTGLQVVSNTISNVNQGIVVVGSSTASY